MLAQTTHSRDVRDAFNLEDLGSKNGTHVNGRSIHRPHRLSSGDTVDIGSTSMIYRWLSGERTQTQQDA